MQSPAPAITLCRMEAEAATFDTHEFVKRLTSAGMAEAQAEIIAWGQSRRHAQLADKRDVKGLEAKIREVEARIKEVEARIREVEARVSEVEARIREVEAKITALEVTIRQIEADLKQELKTQGIAIKALEAAIKEQETKIKELELAITKQEAATRMMEVNLTHSIKEMEHKLTIKLGVFITVGVTILATLIKFS